MIRTIITGIYFILYVLVSLLFLLFLQILKSFGQDRQVQAIASRIARHWARSMVWFAGGKVRVTGAENIPEGAVLFVGNHLSNFDIPLYLGFIPRPTGFVAKIELAKIPVFSTWMRHLKCVFMDRDDIRQSARIINEAADFLRDGYSMTIFPEGTRSKSGIIGEFKAGSLKLAIKAGVPVVPVALIGSNKLLEEQKHLHPANVGLHIFPPIMTSDLTKEEQKELHEKVRGIIRTAIDNDN